MHIIHLNRKILNQKEVKKIFKSVQNKKILKEKGGYLFNSSLKDSDFYIGIRPVIVEGERTHHYEIELDYEDAYKLTGFFNVDGTLGMLFKPPASKHSITDEFKNQLKSSYEQTAEILVQNGFSEQVRFDWITQKMLGEIGLFEPVPQTLGNLLKRF
ncbi:MAG: hypothetical protein JEY91_18940 [Spirochaetaceae bacterium]|nr:hypothetical protein [Spirochaetaceae bacterium]